MRRIICVSLMRSTASHDCAGTAAIHVVSSEEAGADLLILASGCRIETIGGVVHLALRHGTERPDNIRVVVQALPLQLSDLVFKL